MRALLVAVVVTVAGCSEVSTATPCDLITLEQASAAIGAEVSEALPTGTGEGCSYGNPNVDETTMLVHVVGDDPVAFAEARRRASRTAPVDEVDAGDEAFAYGSDEGVEAAEARVGTTRYRVVVIGPRASREGVTSALQLLLGR